ncbi:hypothetical protein hypothetical protein [Pantoea ananatis AJ13355]|uniref:Uncharacterized protein n=1 Tax=Pantoea ananatis (strain AJ13355) TaxID=932677 RepID=A0A0H3KYF0_PANAA|nr:hypothetical protein hypothetical protein [Pantoea ananatis AJ13355]
MRHFRMELHAVEAFLFVRHDGKWTGFCTGNGNKVSRDSGHFVTVTHPDIQQRFTGCADGVFDIANQGACRVDFNLRIAKLTLVGSFHLAAQLHRHGLHAITNTQNRHASREHIVRRARTAMLGCAFRAARQNDAAWIELANLLFGDIPGPEFTVHAKLTYAARNQLRILRTKIENQNAVLMDIFRRH